MPSSSRIRLADSPPPETDMFCEYSCLAVKHRMFVLESLSGSVPWTSNYTLKSHLNTFDRFAIDGTYSRHYSTGLYHIYSCCYRQYDGWPAQPPHHHKQASTPQPVTHHPTNCPIVQPLHHLLVLRQPPNPQRPLQPPGTNHPTTRPFNDRLSTIEGAPNNSPTRAPARPSSSTPPAASFIKTPSNRTYGVGRVQFYDESPMGTRTGSCIMGWRLPTKCY